MNEHDDIFEDLCRRWNSHLLDLDVRTSADAVIINKFSVKENASLDTWHKLVRADSRTCLWEDYPQVVIGENGRCGNTWELSQTYRNVEAMAWLWAHPDSSCYQDKTLREDIIDSLNWLSDYCYNSSLVTGVPFENNYNWYELEIGTPMALSNILVLMRHELSAVQLKGYLCVTEYLNPSPLQRTVHGMEKATGANLLWKAYGVVIRGILLGRPYEINMAKEAVLDVPNQGKDSLFGLTGSSDGFYADGSFVQHEALAYTGGYGVGMLYELSRLLILFHDSPWDFPAWVYVRVYDMMEQSFEPFMDRGRLMDMVRGRGVGRQRESDVCQGVLLLGAMVNLLPYYSGARKRHIESFVKEQTGYMEAAGISRLITNLKILDEIQRIRSDEKILLPAKCEYFKNFASMDRAVGRREDFTVGISMYSSRIADYECGSGENVRGWYTAYGMVSTYDDDVKQYTENFWPTVNPYRLPGTTITQKPRHEVDKGYLKDYRSSKSWTGGSSTGKYGASGMWLEASSSSLTAKKSWFFFEREIVCMGTDIEDDSGYPVETIVDNVRIYGDNEFVSCGGKTMEEKTAEVLTVWLEGNVEKSSRGYYFPYKQPVNLLKEKRTGSWSEADHLNGTDDLLENQFAAVWIDHGKCPAGASYSYIMLPGITKEELRQYEQNCPVQIWENNRMVQAAAYGSGTIVAMNFWYAGQCRGFVAEQALSMVVEALGSEIKVGISDPTQVQERLCITLPYGDCQVYSADEEIEVVYGESGIRIQINTRQSAGRTFTAYLRKNGGSYDSESK